MMLFASSRTATIFAPQQVPVMNCMTSELTRRGSASEEQVWYAVILALVS